MISDLSRTLYAILKQTGLPQPLANADIVFDRPVETFSPTKTTVNLFLYDIHENVELRNNEPVVMRLLPRANIIRPPLRISCSYLVTAWPVGGTDLPLQEQHLLSQVLQILSRYPTIPGTFFKGSLVGQDPPLPMVALHPDSLKNLSEFWTSLGNRMRPSITVTVTIGMNVFAKEYPPLVITEEINLGERISEEETKIKPETLEEVFRIGGKVNDAANRLVPDAIVVLVELGLSTKTDKNGRYSLGIINRGTFTLRVQAGASPPEDFTITVPAAGGNNYNVKLS